MENKRILSMLYFFFWVIPWRLNSDAGELPRRKHTTFRTCRKFEIKNIVKSVYSVYFSHDVLQAAILSDNNIENVNIFHMCVL